MFRALCPVRELQRRPGSEALVITTARQRGFTLIEMMIVVAIITVLVVVANGAYRKYLDNARKSEVYAMFAEIRAKEEAYRAEFSAYLGSGGAENNFWPVVDAAPEPKAKLWAPPPGNWLALGVAPPKSTMYCGYAVVAGIAGSLAGAGAYGTGAYAGAAPTTMWWYATATCDNDGVPGTNAMFVTTSDKDTVYEENVHN
jgi:prepilin-type N-terminal cleavage/methylation domain-containing protein